MSRSSPHSSSVSYDSVLGMCRVLLRSSLKNIRPVQPGLLFPQFRLLGYFEGFVVTKGPCFPF